MDRLFKSGDRKAKLTSLERRRRTTRRGRRRMGLFAYQLIRAGREGEKKEGMEEEEGQASKQVSSHN